MSGLAAPALQADSLPLSHQGSPGDKGAFAYSLCQVKNCVKQTRKILFKIILVMEKLL